MSKIVKGIKKGIKKIFKGVKKVFKKITHSTIGKVLLGAALIYFAPQVLASFGGGGGAALGGSALAAPAAIGEAGFGALVSTGGTALGTTASGGLWSSIGGALKAGAAFAEAHPVLTAAGLNAVSAATTPDEIDLMREQEDQQKRAIKRANKNWAVGDLDVSLTPEEETDDESNNGYNAVSSLIKPIQQKRPGLIRSNYGPY